MSIFSRGTARLFKRHTPETGPTAPKLFGTFGGVFTPTLLTILGVIMYLRLPWVVGNAGLVGGFLVVGLAVGITAATGLSLSSIATNTRLGAGGPYAIISKALGFEIGGSVGLPLYLSQALAVAMYVFGFREGWMWVFPTHPSLLVDLAIFAVIMGIAYVSADLAFRVQYLIMAVIALSLVSVLGNLSVWQSPLEIQAFGSYPGSPEDGFSGTGYWGVFAVFFPAATGILAGANMSGELKNPRVSIPRGTLSAIGVSTVVYSALAVWAAKAAAPQELVSNYTIMIDRSLWGPIVLAGLLGATFSSALTSLVGAPRILAALGKDRILPGGEWVAKTAMGEPRRAMVITGSIVLLGLMTRDLNVIAPLITMFFLITYAVINIVMLAEASLGLMSFRPTLEIPRIVPLLGAVGCIFAMFIVNPTFSLVAVAVVTGIYLWIIWRGTTPRVGTVRSGIFVAFAEWAAGKTMELELSSSRGWKPSLLVPVRDPTTLRGEFRLLVDLTLPEGSIKILGIATTETVEHLTPRVKESMRYFRKRGVMATASVVDSAGYTTGIVTGLQALGSAFFHPNILFLPLLRDTSRHPELEEVIREARRLKVGIMVLGLHDQAGLGRASVINLWISPRGGHQSIQTFLAQTNQDLGILTAVRLARAWGGELNLVTVVQNEEEVAHAHRHIEEVRDLCRIQASARTLAYVGSFHDAIHRAPQADLHVVGLPTSTPMASALEIVRDSRASCLFVVDSGLESALA